MRCLVVLIFFCIPFASLSQGKWSVRINQNTDFFHVTYREQSADRDERVINMDRISAAVSYANKKNIHELELFVPQINSSTPRFPFPQLLYRRPGEGTRIDSYSLRYSVTRNVYSFSKAFSFTLGVGLNPYYLKTQSIPHTQTLFPVISTFVGISANVIPAFNLKAGKRLSFVLDSPVKIADSYYESTRVKNPAIPIRQQTTESYEGRFFMNAFTIRLGVSYTFGGI